MMCQRCGFSLIEKLFSFLSSLLDKGIFKRICLQRNRILNNTKLFPCELTIAIEVRGVTSKQLILNFKTLTKCFKGKQLQTLTKHQWRSLFSVNIKGTVMQIEKAPINDRLRVSKVS